MRTQYMNLLAPLFLGAGVFGAWQNVQNAPNRAPLRRFQYVAEAELQVQLSGADVGRLASDTAAISRATRSRLEQWGVRIHPEQTTTVRPHIVMRLGLLRQVTASPAFYFASAVVQVEIPCKEAGQISQRVVWSSNNVAEEFPTQTAAGSAFFQLAERRVDELISSASARAEIERFRNGVLARC